MTKQTDPLDPFSGASRARARLEMERLASEAGLNVDRFVAAARVCLRASAAREAELDADIERAKRKHAAAAECASGTHPPRFSHTRAVLQQLDADIRAKRERAAPPPSEPELHVRQFLDALGTLQREAARLGDSVPARLVRAALDTAKRWALEL
ncbi:MAG: hypothetical protein VYA51_12955 [Planctomycetota bacterium]|nr:hypothetical protein [Planctomycetota bacterium]